MHTKINEKKHAECNEQKGYWSDESEDIIMPLNPTLTQHDQVLLDHNILDGQVHINYKIDDNTTVLPEYDEIFQLKLPQIKVIFASIKHEWNTIYEEVLNDVIYNDTINAWKRFWMRPKCILYENGRGGKKHTNNKMNQIKNRIHRWRNNQIMELWNDFKKEYFHKSQIQRNKKQKITNECVNMAGDVLTNIRIKRAERYAKMGNLRKASTALESYGIAELNNDNIKKLKQLHPFEEEIKFDPKEYLELPAQIQLSMEEIVHHIKHTDPTTAAGPDGFRPYYWQAILGSPYQNRIMKKIQRLCNKLLNAQINQHITSQVSASTGTPLNKDQTNSGIRPIACGTALVRMTSSLSVRKVINELDQMMNPLQIANSKGGIEIMIHTIRATMNKLKHEKETCMLSMDVSNAFNNLLRHEARVVMQKYVPQLLKYFDLLYTKHSTIYYGSDVIIKSRRGGRQGESIAQLMFSLATFDKMKKRKEIIGSYLSMMIIIPLLK
jgi:hypothetical protein